MPARRAGIHVPLGSGSKQTQDVRKGPDASRPTEAARHLGDGPGEYLNRSEAGAQPIAGRHVLPASRRGHQAVRGDVRRAFRICSAVAVVRGFLSVAQRHRRRGAPVQMICMPVL
jgi:hypothetical protein